MEKRKFSVGPGLIYHTIVAQAGSLGKAVLECVMNSIDAGATRVDIDITNKTVRIRDDGQGFRTRKEIEAYFEVFGFEHTEGDRVYGKFGIGRGQLWSFCSTTWRTGRFNMDVDVKAKGLEYDLEENLPNKKGVDILGTFYTPLKTSEISAFKKELRDLSKYSAIPVYVDGKCISCDPSKQKWDHDTEDAWIRITDQSTLSVYNIGVLVNRYPSYRFGCGGTVVTKPGVSLDLNMARNDILVSRCKVWKRVSKYLQTKSDQRVRNKKTRLSEGELENLAKRAVAGELEYEDICDFKLITDINGRGYTLDQFRSRLYCCPLTVAEDGSRLGEQAHRSGLAFVLGKKTLERFGADSVSHLLEMLNDIRPTFKNVKSFEDLSKAVPSLKDGYSIIAYKDLSKQQRAALSALNKLGSVIGHALCYNLDVVDAKTSSRRINLGVSDSALAWTDGSGSITFDSRTCDLMNKGIGGFCALAAIMVHEYLHDSSDMGTHQHDAEFYQRYHDVTCGRSGILDQAVMKSMKAWHVALKANSLRVPREFSLHLDEVETLEIGAMEENVKPTRIAQAA